MRVLSFIVAISLLVGCSDEPKPRQATQQNDAPQMTDKTSNASLLAAEIRTDWPLHGGDWGETRYSPLKKINRQTVRRLGLAWEYDGFYVRGRTHRGVETTPLMADGTLYLTGPWSTVHALDAQTGKELWTFDPEVDGAWARRACCDAVNRGAALWRNYIITATLDGYLIALNKTSGDEIWRTDTFTSRDTNYTITGAPRLAGDLVVIGNGGAELGARGYVSAYNAQTGQLVWRFFTVPGAGPDEHEEIGLARKTWGPDARFDIGGGGTVWDSMVYDPALDLIYIGVGNGSPWPRWARDPSGGDNLFLSSILALDAKTGRMRWYYQTTPGDSWDYTATQHMILTDLVLGGQTRRVLMQAPKNGFFYILDRETGELLSAEKYTVATWAERIDEATGRPVFADQGNYAGDAKVVWPGTPGGHNWQPMAHNPQTGLTYIPVLEMPQRFQLAQSPKFLPYTNNIQADVKAPPFKTDDPAFEKSGPPPTQMAILRAWNPVSQSVAWESKPQTWWGGGVLTTAGGLVVQGSSDGVLRVFDAKTGDILKSIDIGTGIMAAPITYALNGVQYIGVAAGYGGAQNARFLPGMAARERQNSERFLVFKLDGGPVSLPSAVEPAEAQPLFDIGPVDEATIEHGKTLYKAYCGRCHAPMNNPAGYPNLWNLPPHVHDNFNAIVLDGIYAYSGMAGFSDVLDENDARSIQAFIVDSQANLEQR